MDTHDPTRPQRKPRPNVSAKQRYINRLRRLRKKREQAGRERDQKGSPKKKEKPPAD